MSNGKVMIINLIVSLIKNCYMKIRCFLPYGHSKSKIEVELDLFNYGRKSESENATGIDTSQFTKKVI